MVGLRKTASNPGLEIRPTGKRSSLSLVPSGFGTRSEVVEAPLPRSNRPETFSTGTLVEEGFAASLAGFFRRHRSPVSAVILGAGILPGLTGAAVATVNTADVPIDPIAPMPPDGGIGFCHAAFGTQNPSLTITSLPPNVQGLARWVDGTLGDGDGNLSGRELSGFVGRSGPAGNRNEGPIADLIRAFANAVSQDAALSGPASLDPGSLELARSMTHAGGTSPASDVDLVVKELARLPKVLLERAKAKGITVATSREVITDHLPGLSGVTPRGWPAGKTWDDVPGLYHPATREVVVSIKDDGFGGRCVPPTASGHGSDNLVLHEFAHALDYRHVFRSLSAGSAAFGAAYQADLLRLEAADEDYLMQGGVAGREEAFAESFSRYFSRDAKLAADWPGLHAFWQGFEVEHLT